MRGKALIAVELLDGSDVGYQSVGHEVDGRLFLDTKLPHRLLGVVVEARHEIDRVSAVIVVGKKN